MDSIKKLWHAFIEAIDSKEEAYHARKSKNNTAAFVAKSEEIYNIVQRNGQACILVNGKPASFGDDEARLVQRLFTLREAYVHECITKGEAL